MNQSSTAVDFTLPTWAYAYGQPEVSGKLKTQPKDFVVVEQLAFQPSGEGEHVFLQIKKTGENTDYVARLLARFAGVRQRDIGYAGLKDRHAVTTQWFSVWLPGQAEPDWHFLETEQIKILQIARHARKIKRGALSTNDFNLTIRNLQGSQKALEKRLQAIKQQGFPNYFTAQRFGYNGQNIHRAIEMFQGRKVKRQQRSLYLSAVRSYLFNQVLSARVQQNTWDQMMLGDVLSLNQSNSFFTVDKPDRLLSTRVQTGELHPTGMLFGRQPLVSRTDVWQLENNIIEQNGVLTDGLIQYDLTTGRRALRVKAIDLHGQFLTDDCIQLEFSLPAGSYATALVRELINFDSD